MKHIFCIVEGHGDERAIPILIRNYYEYIGQYDVNILRPYRLPKGQFVSEIGDVIRFGVSRLVSEMQNDDNGLILLACDADDDCPVALRETINRLVSVTESNVRVEAVIANREYEAWLLASSKSFNGHPDCVDPVPEFDNPDGFRDAKGVFEARVLKQNRYYSETVDQPKFSSLIKFGLQPETNSRSLRRLISALSSAD